MTNKEAKEKLYIEWQKFLEDNIDYAGVSEAYKLAFKALEQEPILDKIRAEILQLKTKTSFTFVNIDDVLRLIDKEYQKGRNT